MMATLKLRVLDALRRINDEVAWNPADHPRDEKGRFALLEAHWHAQQEFERKRDEYLHAVNQGRDWPQHRNPKKEAELKQAAEEAAARRDAAHAAARKAGAFDLQNERRRLYFDRKAQIERDHNPDMASVPTSLSPRELLAAHQESEADLEEKRDAYHRASARAFHVPSHENIEASESAMRAAYKALARHKGIRAAAEKAGVVAPHPHYRPKVSMGRVSLTSHPSAHYLSRIGDAFHAWSRRRTRDALRVVSETFDVWRAADHPRGPGGRFIKKNGSAKGRTSKPKTRAKTKTSTPPKENGPSPVEQEAVHKIGGIAIHEASTQNLKKYLTGSREAVARWGKPTVGKSRAIKAELEKREIEKRAPPSRRSTTTQGTVSEAWHDPEIAALMKARHVWAREADRHLAHIRLGMDSLLAPRSRFRRG